MKHIILSCLLFASSTLAAQTQVFNYNPSATTDGATFFLPRTAIRISVLTEKTVYTPGEYAAYAQRFLRLNDVSTEANITHRILAISQMAVGVADTTKAYTIKFNPKTSATNVTLAQDGTLLAINATSEGQILPARFQAAPQTPLPDPHRFQNEEILAAGSLSKMAQLTAQEIYDLRENRNLLIKGQADFMPNDGAQMKMMLERLETQDRTLTQLFSGVTERDTTEVSFTVIPDGSMQKQVLFRLSRKLGIVDADDLSGEPYYIDVEDLKTVPPVDEEAAAKNKKKKQPESGIYVNVPGRMRSTIYRDENTLSTAEFPAGQFGNVELLSGELFDKHFTTRLWLNELTGAVEKLEAEQPK